jgi:hypothetical protein
MMDGNMAGLVGVMRRPRGMMAWAIVAALYLVVLVAEPFLHHSVACHANTPTHCTACALQMTSPGVEDDSLLQAIVLLPEAGKLLPDSLPHDVAPLVTRTKDRSPPA